MARRKGIDFPGMVASGENPNGFRAQTADGTEKDERGLPPQGWKWGYQADGVRWNGANPEPEYSVPVAGTRRRRR